MALYLITFGSFGVAMVAALVLARWLTGVARAVALRRGVLSQVTARSSHNQPTPRLGGLGLVAGFTLASAIFLGALWLQRAWIAAGERGILGFNPAVVGWVGLGLGLMFLVGLADDLWDLPALAKLGLMAVAALAPAAGGGVYCGFPLGPNIPTWADQAFSIALTLLWILFFTNAFNFMDGMDGFAANFARMASVFLFLVLLLNGLEFGALPSLRGEAYLMPILAMACWGFLHWNRPPAQVFMGDAGSLSVGYLLAIWPVMGREGFFGLRLSGLSSLTVLLPFVFDVVLTLLRRARLGQNLLAAHREHLYQRLLRTGLTHVQVLRMNVARFVLCGGLVLAGHFWNNPHAPWAVLAAALGVMIQYWMETLARERRAGLGR